MLRFYLDTQNSLSVSFSTVTDYAACWRQKVFVFQHTQMSSGTILLSQTRLSSYIKQKGGLKRFKGKLRRP